MQRITPEDPLVRSVICLNGTSEALPVSAEYDAFVRKPTGVIQDRFNHPVFRMDLAGRIESGRSWQLGVFVAHGLHHVGALAGKDDTPGRLLWATGEVDRELLVRPVEHLAQKLDNSLEALTHWQEQGIEVVLAIPAANLAEVGEGWLERHGLTRHRLMPVTRADTLLQHLLPAPEPSRPDGELEFQAGTPAPPSHRLLHTLAALLVAVGGAALFAWSNGLADWLGLLREGRHEMLHQALDEAEDCPPCRWLREGFLAYVRQDLPRPDALDYSLKEWRAPWGGGCPATWRGMERTLNVERPATPEAPFPASEGSGLCGVRYRVGNPGPPLEARLLVLHQGRLLDPGPGGAPPAVLESGATLEQDYMVNGPLQRQGGVIQVAVLLSRHPLGELHATLVNRIRRQSLPWSPGQWEALRIEMEPLGVALLVTSHGILARKPDKSQEPTVLHYPAPVPVEEVKPAPPEPVPATPVTPAAPAAPVTPATFVSS